MTSDAIENFRKRISKVELANTALTKRTANGMHTIGDISKNVVTNTARIDLIEMEPKGDNELVDIRKMQLRFQSDVARFENDVASLHTSINANEQQISVLAQNVSADRIEENIQEKFEPKLQSEIIKVRSLISQNEQKVDSLVGKNIQKVEATFTAALGDLRRKVVATQNKMGENYNQVDSRITQSIDDYHKLSNSLSKVNSNFKNGFDRLDSTLDTAVREVNERHAELNNTVSTLRYSFNDKLHHLNDSLIATVNDMVATVNNMVAQQGTHQNASIIDDRQKLEELQEEYRFQLDKFKSLRNLVLGIEKNTENKISDAESKIDSLSKELG